MKAVLASNKSNTLLTHSIVYLEQSFREHVLKVFLITTLEENLDICLIRLPKRACVAKRTLKRHHDHWYSLTAKELIRLR